MQKNISLSIVYCIYKILNKFYTTYVYFAFIIIVVFVVLVVGFMAVVKHTNK
jgi:hypothetical protein